MRALLHSVRMAPQKVRVIAGVVRGLPLDDALLSLSRMHKKGARIIERVLRSARANAAHNDKQEPTSLYVKELLVQQGTAYKRGVSMARGRVRPIRKFLSHIKVQLGVAREREKRKNSQKTQKIQKTQRTQKSVSSGSSVSFDSSGSSS